MKRFTVREARKRAGLTQEQLAAAAGMRQGVVSSIETGKVANPGIALALRLAKALKVRPEQLRFGPVDVETAQ
jgi:transcriptional regulator with XRE-family HTH domain